jgi:trehalose synthase
VASNVGGISLQIEDGKNGFLVDSTDVEEFASKTTEVLRNPDFARSIGIQGKEKVRANFLITRLLMDYLDLLNDMIKCPFAESGRAEKSAGQNQYSNNTARISTT